MKPTRHSGALKLKVKAALYTTTKIFAICPLGLRSAERSDRNRSFQYVTSILCRHVQHPPKRGESRPRTSGIRRQPISGEGEDLGDRSSSVLWAIYFAWLRSTPGPTPSDRHRCTILQEKPPKQVCVWLTNVSRNWDPNGSSRVGENGKENCADKQELHSRRCTRRLTYRDAPFGLYTYILHQPV